MASKHIGNSFDSFLQEEGLMAEAEATALKRLLAYQISERLGFKARSLSSALALQHLSSHCQGPTGFILYNEGVRECFSRALLIFFRK